jgi:hypothetical protein
VYNIFVSKKIIETCKVYCKRTQKEEENGKEKKNLLKFSFYCHNLLTDQM